MTSEFGGFPAQDQTLLIVPYDMREATPIVHQRLLDVIIHLNGIDEFKSHCSENNIGFNVLLQNAVPEISVSIGYQYRHLGPRCSFTGNVSVQGSMPCR